MKEKQRELGTESHLNAIIKSEDKRKISIYSKLRRTAFPLEFTIFSIQRFIPSQQFYSPLVFNPENCRFSHDVFKINKLT